MSGKVDYRVFGKEPIPKDITPKELSGALLRHGFEIRQGKGSHVVAIIRFPDGVTWNYPIPFGGRKTVLPVYIRKIRDAMAEHKMEVHFA